MIPASLAWTIGKYALPAILAASVAVSCTAQRYQGKIDRMVIAEQNALLKAHADAQAKIAANAKRNEELTREHQKAVADLSARYAAARLRAQALSASSLPKANSTSTPDAVAQSDRLPDGMGTLELIEQCDLNTQKLVGLQGWLSEQ